MMYNHQTMVKRAYKFRFQPNQEQRIQLAQIFGCTRFVYNWGLRLRTDAYYQEQQKITYQETSQQLTNLKKNPEYA